MRSFLPLILCGLLSSQVVSAQTTTVEAVSSDKKIPLLKANGGLRFDSQGAGTPNTLSGYAFLPILANNRGDILFAESYINWNIASDGIDSSIGSSTRLGYRWLAENKSWIYGVNAGIDNRPFQAQNFLQAGVGLEALSPNIELRVNGYIPFSQTSNLYSTAYNGAYGLVNDQLQLNRSRWFGVALGGIDAEVGTPVARWQGGDLRLYASYYYLDGDYVSGSSGVRARAELRLGDKLSVGGTVSYDDIFQTQATGYVRLGFSPQQKPVGKTISDAEDLFLAQRGLPVDRQRVIQVANQQVLDQEAARDPLTNKQWVVRCVGQNASAYSVRCGYGDLSAAVNAIGAPADVLLLANGTNSNLNGSTLRLPASTNLSNGANAPVLATQGGFIPLAAVFGPGNGAAPQINNGVLSIGSNTTIAGLAFNNASITNYSTKNVLIANNNFVGSYTDNPTPLATAMANGPINVSASALPAIQLNDVENLVISNNSFIYPQVQTYVSQRGSVDGGGTDQVCNQNGKNKSGLCLSGNAIRLNNSNNTMISGNTVIGALDEAFRINNPTGNLSIIGNTISGMRMGPDSNIGTAIIVGQNQGTSNIIISNNYFSNNSAGVYDTVLSANQSNIAASGTKNNIDPIEIGLCRGSISYPRYNDLYADPNFSGNCNGPTTMNVTVSNNTIYLPALSNPYKQDEDGIDFNVGNNSILNTNVSSNIVQDLGGTGQGDNGITFDIRGNAINQISITNNSINNASKEAISFDFTNSTQANQPGFGNINVSGNTQTKTKGLFAIGVIDNPGMPVSNFYVTGLGDNAEQLKAAKLCRNDYNKSNTYANVYLNGVLTPIVQDCN
ncbi:inverse autotransporter beta domain-containing protein [Synechococcus sp. UW140]|uniref:inverse autotransporter beta domain-containing protein n=1 Tax=Synechococcus sp. UW140 TaxID=368503 RepID=UPI003137986C